jgi:CRP/FNR family cyclic AMP-dependent transcriptional regulator
VNKPTLIETFFRERPVRLHRKNSIIFDAGQNADGLYFLVSGRLKLSTTNNKGQERIFFTLGPGDSFPYGPYFLKHPMTASYTAMTDIEAIWRPRHEVDEFFDKNPDALREIITIITLAFYSRIEDLTLGASEQRIVNRIMNLAERFGVPSPDGGVEISITQQELADSINLSRESTSLILNRLELVNIVQLQRSKIVVDTAKARFLIGDES